MSTTNSITTLDKAALETKVKAMYKDVAERPDGEYHFEMGRELALKLGYNAWDLNAIPAESVDSFAGVGCYFPLADIQPGEKILDLGSGSGMDAFIAALKTGKSGLVTGIDMTDAQLEKARRLAESNHFENTEFIKAYIEELPVRENTYDVVISNGVINLSPDKEIAFAEIACALKPGGRMAISDIVTEVQMPLSITCDSTLWAACIGGAMQQDDYFTAIERVGLKIKQVVENKEYQFISRSAINSSAKYGVKSISVLAVKE